MQANLAVIFDTFPTPPYVDYLPIYQRNEVKDAQTGRACEQAKIGRKIAAHPLNLRTTLRLRLKQLE